MIFLNPYFVYDYMLRRNLSNSKVINSYNKTISISRFEIQATKIEVTNYSFCRTNQHREYMSNEDEVSFYSKCRR